MAINILPTLNIKLLSTDNDIIKYYTESCEQTCKRIETSSSGFDLVVAEDYVLQMVKQTLVLKLGIAGSPNFSGGYDLVPRSSIYKTPLRMANSIGIIDNEYRGEICAPVDFYPDLVKNTNNRDDNDDNTNPNTYKIEKGTRLFQLVHGSRLPLCCRIVEELSDTKRGENGFGSTGSGLIEKGTQ